MSYLPTKQEGIAALRRGDARNACRLLCAAAEAQPDDAGVLGYLGVAYAWEQQFEQAIACLKAATRLSPDLAPLHHNLGLALEQRGDLSEALTAYECALRVDPEYRLSINACLRIRNCVSSSEVQRAVGADECCPTAAVKHVADRDHPTSNAEQEELPRSSAPADGPGAPLDGSPSAGQDSGSASGPAPLHLDIPRWWRLNRLFTSMCCALAATFLWAALHSVDPLRRDRPRNLQGSPLAAPAPVTLSSANRSNRIEPPVMGSETAVPSRKNAGILPHLAAPRSISSPKAAAQRSHPAAVIQPRVLPSIRIGAAVARADKDSRIYEQRAHKYRAYAALYTRLDPSSSAAQAQLQAANYLTSRATRAREERDYARLRLANAYLAEGRRLEAAREFQRLSGDRTVSPGIRTRASTGLHQQGLGKP